MKIKLHLFLFLFLVLNFTVSAQDSHTSNTDRKWYLPDHVVGQFAGNIGLFAVGPGYSYLKDKINSELLYGYVPSFESNTSIHVLTIKTSYHPFKVPLSETYMLDVVRIGSGLSYSIGPQFHTKWPSRYPDSYYWWASSLRITPFIGSAISRKVGAEYTHIKRVELYWELGTNDLDIISKLSNKSLSVWDITNIALGTKLVF